jgi:uncharacterized RDD family membrane protein YckC
MSARLVYAGRGERFLAYLLDALFILIPTRLVAGLFITTDANGEMTVDAIFYPIMFLINLVYYAAFTASRWQATPGKRLVGIRVVRVDGARLDALDATERFLAFTLPFTPLYVSILSPAIGKMLSMMLVVYWFLPILYTPEHAGIHDRLCRTRVITGRTRA